MPPSKLMHFFTLILIIRPIISQFYYDKSNCSSSESLVNGFNYECNSTSHSCNTFIVYRAQKSYRSLSSIASLFSTRIDQLLPYNNISLADQDFLYPGREIIIPIKCSCSNSLFRALVEYDASPSDSSYSAIACENFEGLVKARDLKEFNPSFEGENSSLIQVPVKCACPDTSNVENGTIYYVAYPVMENDNTDLIGRKFGIAEKFIWDANMLNPFDTVFAQTTLFIPMTSIPIVNLDVALAPSPRDAASGTRVFVVSGGKSSWTISQSMNFYASLGGVFMGVILLITFLRGLSSMLMKNQKEIAGRLSRTFSLGFLDGMSKLKHSFTYFSLEELMIATENFSEATAIGPGVYKGKFGSAYMAIKEVNFREAANRVISILTKIYHLNVVKLEGICDGTTPYLVFELAENGSLRECLSNSKLAEQFTWKRRIQVAFDLAGGLHYLHYSTRPTYVHRNINSRNVLINADWRAKISGFEYAVPLDCNEEKLESNWRESALVDKEGYLAPEYLKSGQVSTKVDVYAFGVVLLELLSAKETIENGKLLKDFLNFSSNRDVQDSYGYIEKLESFIDPLLRRDCPMADVLYLVFLAKGCSEEDPLHRPTMNDVLKALARIL